VQFLKSVSGFEAVFVVTDLTARSLTLCFPVSACCSQRGWNPCWAWVVSTVGKQGNV